MTELDLRLEENGYLKVADDQRMKEHLGGVDWSQTRAFALGLTLFVFTLGLNVLALIIVRKYREQYE